MDEGIIVADGTLVAYREECIAALNSVDLDAVESVSNALLEARDRGSHVSSSSATAGAPPQLVTWRRISC